MNSKLFPSLSFAILSIITVHVSSEPENFFQVTDPVKIESLKDVTPNQILKASELGLVYGARNCGISGHVQEIRTEYCRTDVPALCSLHSKENTKVNFIFVPSENINDYKVRLTVSSSDGQPTSYETLMSGRKLKKGQQYLYSFEVSMAEILEGKFFSGRAEIIDNLDKQIKICAGADYYVWPKSGLTLTNIYK